MNHILQQTLTAEQLCVSSAYSRSIVAFTLPQIDDLAVLSLTLKNLRNNLITHRSATANSTCIRYIYMYSVYTVGQDPKRFARYNVDR